jgi:hypothetical protein
VTARTPVRTLTAIAVGALVGLAFDAACHDELASAILAGVVAVLVG